MNGVAAQSMRDKGVNYKLNWGASIADLERMAEEVKTDFKANADNNLLVDLAKRLWSDKVRESNLLAVMIMPPDLFEIDDAIDWSYSVEHLEIAEAVAFRLLPRTKEPQSLLHRMADNEKFTSETSETNPFYQLIVFHFASRLLIVNMSLDEETKSVLFEKSFSILSDATLPLWLRKAANVFSNRVSE